MEGTRATLAPALLRSSPLQSSLARLKRAGGQRRPAALASERALAANANSSGKGKLVAAWLQSCWRRAASGEQEGQSWPG